MLRNAKPYSSEDPTPSTIKTGEDITLLIDRTPIKRSITPKLFGIQIDLQLNFDNHVASLC